MIISLDTETQGVDVYHKSRPFFVTSCDDTGMIRYWEWKVDPLTRMPIIPPRDIEEIKSLILSAEEIIGQNLKFDVGMLESIGITNFPWHKVQDTLIAGHVLASNQPHDLTSMTLHYLGVDIESLEKAVHEAVETARRRVRSHLKEWRISRKDDEDAPSVKSRVWMADYWLPKAVCDYARDQERIEQEKLSEEIIGDSRMMTQCTLLSQEDDSIQMTPTEQLLTKAGKPRKIRVKKAIPLWWKEFIDPEHPWNYILRDYANADSETAILLWKVMRQRLDERGLWNIYRERMRVVPIAYGMESKGITLSMERLNSLKSRAINESLENAEKCMMIAESYGCSIVLGKTGNTESVRNFCFEELNLPVIKKTDKGNPGFDKAVFKEWENHLHPKTKAYQFVKSLSRKRLRDTSLGYLEGYERFILSWEEYDKQWAILHPSMNITGTDTLRWSTKNPSVQNIGKDEDFSLRYCFGPAPGREWWSLDYENIELRIPSYESQEESMIELFERPEDPPYYGSQHLLYFDILHPEKFKEHGKKVKDVFKSTWYQWTKNGDFALQYGAMKETADRAYHVNGAYEILKSRFKKLDALNLKYIKMAEKCGYVETLPDKEVSPNQGYPVMCTRSEWGKILPTVPLNYHIQGCLWGGSRVLTPQGLIPIRELVNKECSVWTGFNWAKAIGLNRGPCQRATIKLSSGLTVHCDTRHKLKNEKDKWIDFANLAVGQYVALPMNPDPMPYSGTMNWWFLMGFILGDGHLAKRSSRRYLAIVVGEKKLPILNSIEKFLSHYSGDKYGRPGYGRVRRSVKPPKGKHRELYYLGLENYKFADELESYGMSFNWRFNTKRIPESVWRTTPQNQRDFLEGLWLSDGSRSETSGSGRSLSMTNPELLKDVQILSSNLGFDGHLCGTRLCFRWRAFRAKSSRAYPAYALVSKLKQTTRIGYKGNVGTTDQRNLSLALQGKDISQYVAERILSRENTETRIYRYDQIKEIKIEEGTEDTYTMAVDHPLHQFVADGVIHANTAMWCTMKAMIRCDQYLKELNKKDSRGYFMVMQVHDELVFDFPKGGKENLDKIHHIQKLMVKSGDDIGIPLRVSVTYNPTHWAKGEDY